MKEKGNKKMHIKILGGGCSNCSRLEQNVREALANQNMQASLEKVTDYAQIASHGILSTPGLIVDDKILSSGKVLSVEQIGKLICQP